MPSLPQITKKMVGCPGWYARAYLELFSLLCYFLTFGFRETSMSLSTTTGPNHKKFCFVGMPSVSTITRIMVNCRDRYTRACLESFSLLCYLLTFGLRERSMSLSTTTEPNHRKFC